MATDARISTGLPSHPKTKKLLRRLGPAGGWSLLCLILWARANRPDGDLAGMSSEDVELAADWTGEAERFVRELVAVGFLDGEDGAFTLHDWAEHQPWAAGSEARSKKSRWAALCKRHGREEAASLMPEYAARLQTASHPRATGVPGAVPESASGMPVAPQEVPVEEAGMPLAASGSAPSPSPSPSPNTPLTPQGGDEGGQPDDSQPKLPGEDDPLFVAFYAAYPRKTGRADAWKAWKALKVTPTMAHAIMVGLGKWQVHERWTKEGGRFIKTPGPWLRGRLWEDEEVCGSLRSGPAGAVPQWCTDAGFDTVEDAHNRMCWEHNAHQFSDGRRIADKGVPA